MLHVIMKIIDIIISMSSMYYIILITLGSDISIANSRHGSRRIVYGY